MMRIHPVLDSVLDLFFPQTCPGCGAASDEGRGLCAGCHSEIGDRFLPFDEPQFIRSAWSLGPYDGPLGALIRRGKYTSDGHVLTALGGRLGQAGRGRLPPVDLVCHVPVPWTRRASRGFDQAALLARPLAQALEKPHRSILRRVGRTEQAGRSKRERHRWARGAFQATELRDSRVLLVDDVCTTGATASGCASALLSSGARTVDLVCVARTLSDLQ